MSEAPAAEAAGASEALRREPWEDLDRQRAAGTFGIWLFLASEVLFFGALILTYSVYRYTFPDGFAAAARETDVVLGTLNTAILLTSSFTVAMAAAIAEAAPGARLTPEHRRWISLLLACTVALGVAFLIVKGFEYREDLERNLWPGRAFPIPDRGAVTFFALYWLVTAVHAVHLSIGIVAMGRLLLLGLRTSRPYAHNPELAVTALYWHLVDVVWIMLYPLIYLPGRAAP